MATSLLRHPVIASALIYLSATFLTLMLWDLFLWRFPFTLYFLGVLLIAHIDGFVMSLMLNVASVLTTAWLLHSEQGIARKELTLIFCVAALAAHVVARRSDERRRLETINLSLAREREALETERRRLAEERARLEYAVQQMPIGVMIVERQSHRLLFVNQTAERILGHSVELDDNPLEYFEHYGFSPDGLPFPPEGHPLARALLRGETVMDEDFRYVTGGGAEIILSASAAPIQDGDEAIAAALLVFTNVTERRQLETRLAQSQRLEALGRLSGGVAHDFNNILTAIIGYADLLQHEPERAEYSQQIVRSAQRASDLTRQLLAFGRRQVLRPAAVDVNEVVTDVLPMLRRVVGAHIEIVPDLHDGGTTVRVDPGQLEQVIANLVTNAADAMPKGGRVFIRTGTIDRDGDAAAPLCLPAERCVMLAISDTGVGMDRETQARIFEPFFTTKQLGRGSGLGLATTYGIVEQSGGRILVDSEPGKGSTLTVYLPATDESAVPVSSVTDTEPLLEATETILLVEDEDDVRALADTVLRQAGYVVWACSGPADALRRLVSEQKPADLLLTDVVLAEGSGASLAGSLREKWPEMRILFMSGYSESMVSQHGVSRDGDAFLSKPFTPAGLRQAVRRALERDSTATDETNGSAPTTTTVGAVPPH